MSGSFNKTAQDCLINMSTCMCNANDNSYREQGLMGKITSYPKSASGITALFICLVPSVGKIIKFCAVIGHLARSGLLAASYKKNFPESHMINPLLTKFVR